MRHRRLDLNLLAALDVLLAERSVTRAAASLNVTQSTMSGILNRLRECFDDPLLVQSGRRLQLTPLAESLIGPSQAAMERINALLDTQPVFHPATARRKITIATSDYVISAFLAPLIADISKEAPGLTFDLVPPVTGFGGELDSGAVDFVICPGYLASADHPQANIFEDGYTVVAWSDSTALGKTIDLAQYQRLGHVIFKPGRSRPWFDQWYLTEHGDSRRIEVQVATFSLMPVMVIGTERIATVQTRLAQRMAQTLPLRLFPAPVNVPMLTEALQWSRHRQADPVHAWLRSQLLGGGSRERLAQDLATDVPPG